MRLEKFEPFLEELCTKSKSRTVTIGLVRPFPGGDDSVFANLVEMYSSKSRTGVEASQSLCRPTPELHNPHL